MRCVFCNDEIKGEVFTTSSGFQIALDVGHNVDPVAKEGRCCEKCNYSIVMPARIRNSNINKMDIEHTYPEMVKDDFAGACNITKGIIKDLIDSDKKGVKEYGTTVDREDYNLKEWLEHAYEETLDTAKYLAAAIKKLENQNKDE